MLCTRDTGNAGRAVQDGVDAIVTAGGLSGDGYSARYNVDYAQHRIRVDIYGERGLPLAIKEADAILVQGIAASCFDFDNPNKLGVDLCTIARVFHISVDKMYALAPRLYLGLCSSADPYSSAASASSSGRAVRSKASRAGASRSISRRPSRATSSATP